MSLFFIFQSCSYIIGIIGACAFGMATLFFVSMFTHYAEIYAESRGNLSVYFKVSSADEIYSKLIDEIIIDDLKCNYDN